MAREVRAGRRDDRPPAVAGACADAALTGVGIGRAFALGVLGSLRAQVLA